MKMSFGEPAKHGHRAYLNLRFNQPRLIEQNGGQNRNMFDKKSLDAMFSELRDAYELEPEWEEIQRDAHLGPHLSGPKSGRRSKITDQWSTPWIAEPEPVTKGDGPVIMGPFFLFPRYAYRWLSTWK